jgi:hypothetical protein
MGIRCFIDALKHNMLHDKTSDVVVHKADYTANYCGSALGVVGVAGAVAAAGTAVGGTGSAATGFCAEGLGGGK